MNHNTHINIFAVTGTNGATVFVGSGHDLVDTTGMNTSQREVATVLNEEQAQRLAILAFGKVQPVTITKVVGPNPVLPEFKPTAPVGARSVKLLLASNPKSSSGLMQEFGIPSKLAGRVITRAISHLRGWPNGTSRNGERPTVEEAALEACEHFAR